MNIYYSIIILYGVCMYGVCMVYVCMYVNMYMYVYMCICMYLFGQLMDEDQVRSGYQSQEEEHQLSGLSCAAKKLLLRRSESLFET